MSQMMQPSFQQKILLLTDERSFIRNHVRLQTEGFRKINISSDWQSINQTLRDHQVLNIHFGNSTRRTIPYLMKNKIRDYILTFHDILPRFKWVRFLLMPFNQWVISRAKGLVFHSHFAYQLFQKHYTFNKPCCVIPVGGEIYPQSQFLRKYFQLPQGQLVLIYPGIIKPSKGIETMFQVIEKLNRTIGDEKFCFIFSGKTIPSPYHQKLLTSLPRNCYLLENPDDHAFIEAIASADACLSFKDASIGETSGPIMQSFGAGVPVLANPIGANSEIIPNCGELSLSNSVQDIQDVLMHWISNEPYRKKLQEKVLENRSLWTWEMMAKKYIEFFVKLGFD